MPAPNDPSLVAKALAKAQSVESRLNAVIDGTTPVSPSIVYGSNTTVVTQSTGGSYTWTCPAGVTTAYVECWGGGAGAGGGNSSKGGEGGGGGGYSAEAAYEVVPGTVYTYVVGDGGDGGASGFPGVNGGDSYFDPNAPSGFGVYAYGGSAGNAFIGGPGGIASGNSITFAGGSGGGDSTQSTGGCGGGSSASPAGAGLNGSKSTSATGAAGGASGTDRGGGGAGGNSAANGTIGGSPGAGGGGCGAATGSGQVSFTYHPTSSATYYGHDASGGNANQKRTSVGATMYQGGQTSSGGTYNGTMKSVMLLPSSIVSDLTGVTIDSCTLTLFNQHSWYNSGMTVQLGYGSYTSLGSSYSGGGLTNVKAYSVPENASHTTVLTSTGVPAALKSGACKAFVLGLAPDYNLNYYGYFSGAGQSNAPTLSVTGHTGSAPVIAGDGADGRVRITYATNSAVVAALQPAAVTDDSGNQVAAGLTGLVTAVQPGSSPSLPEDWHSVGAASQPSFVNGWANLGGGQVTLQFRMTALNCVHIVGVVSAASMTATTIFTLPAGYAPTSQLEAPVAPHTAIGGLFLSVATSGAVSITNSTNASGNITINALIPIDSN